MYYLIYPELFDKYLFFYNYLLFLKFIIFTELFIDTDKKSFTALSYRKHSYLSIVPTLIAKVARNALSRSKLLNIDGNMKGDGFQMGGLLVVAAKGEKILFEFRQENPAEHATNHDILQVCW